MLRKKKFCTNSDLNIRNLAMKTTGLTGMISTACLCLYQGVQNFGKLCIFKVPHILFKMFSWGVSKIILDKISNGQHRFIIIISPTVLKKIIPQFYSLIMIVWSSVCLYSQSPVLSVNNLYLYLSLTLPLTGADISTIVNQAALKAANDEAPFVTMEHLDYAVDKFLMGQCFGSFNFNYLKVLVQNFFTYSLL